MPKMGTIPKTIGSGVDAKRWISDNATWVQDATKKHEKWLKETEVERMQALYDGYIESVDKRDKNRGDEINNKLMVSYGAIIIDTLVDYMLGKAITWTVEDPDAKVGAEESDQLKDFRKKFIATAGGDDARLQLVEMLRHGCIAGYSPLISWLDEDGEIAHSEYPVQEVIPIYDTRGRLRLVLRYYKDEYTEDGATKSKVYLEVYDEKYVTYFTGDAEGTGFSVNEEELETGNPYAHRVNGIPVTVFRNGTPASYKARQYMAGTSDLKPVVSLIEDYASKMSDKANLVEYLMDQYLLLVGVDTDENEVIKMRKARALVLKGDKNISDARFIAQTQDDAAAENHLKRVKESIFETSFTPQVSDLAGKTAYEVSMKFKDLDVKAGKKETYLLPAIKRYIEITVDLMNAIAAAEAKGTDVEELDDDFKADDSKATTYKAEWVGITLNRNIPQNHKDITDIVATLSAAGVPDSYLYELLWFVEDPKQALEEKKKQKAEEAKQALASSIGYGADFNSTELTDEQKAAQAAAKEA